VNFKTGGAERLLNISVCCLAVAKVNLPRLFNFLSSDCHLIAIPTWRHNAEDTKFIEKEIQELVKAGVIEEASTPWRAQVLVSRDVWHKPRIAIDYSETTNRFTQLDAYPLPRIEDQVAQLSKSKYFSTLDLKSAYYQMPIPPEDKKYTGFEALGKFYQFTRVPLGATNGVSAFQRIIDTVIQKHGLHRTYAYLDNITVGTATVEEHDKNLAAFLKDIRINKAPSKLQTNTNNLKCVLPLIVDYHSCFFCLSPPFSSLIFLFFAFFA